MPAMFSSWIISAAWELSLLPTPLMMIATFSLVVFLISFYLIYIFDLSDSLQVEPVIVVSVR